MTRVFSLAQVFLEADDPRIWDFRRTKVVDYFFGNEFTEAEESIILFACMLHVYLMVVRKMGLTGTERNG